MDYETVKKVLDMLASAEQTEDFLNSITEEQHEAIYNHQFFEFDTDGKVMSYMLP